MRKIIYTIILFLAYNYMYGQIHNTEYSLRLHAGSSNFYMGLLGTLVMVSTIPYVEDDDDSDYAWVKGMPIYDWMVGIPAVANPLGSPKMKSRAGYFDAPWEHGLGDGYVGLEYTITSVRSPIGLIIDADYKNHGCNIDEKTYTSHIFAPSASLMIKLGDFKSYVRPVLQIGGGYDFIVNYSGDKNYNKDILNSGFFAKASVGVSIPSAHSMVTLQYQRDFYDFFNQDYSVGGVKPFDGYKRTNSYIMLKLSHFWNRR